MKLIKTTMTICISFAVLFFFTQSVFAQTENIKGVRFKDGSTIYGKVLEMNVYKIKIKTEDGRIFVRDFSEVNYFITDEKKEDVKVKPVVVEEKAKDKESLSGFYIGLLGGAVFPRDVKVTDKSSHHYSFADQDLDDGYVMGAKIGYLMSNNIFGGEVEYNYVRGADLKKQYAYTDSGTPTDVEANIYIHSLFLNFIARYPGGKFHPYMGVGPGWSWFKVKDAKKITPTTTSASYHDSDKRFAYQLLAGIEYDLAHNVGILLGYKWYKCKPRFSDFELDTVYKTHILTLGLNYQF